ncbi:TRAP transporter substrate-binding protein [Salicibibacter cibi]|uniref:TRAP transporter substrate-binding protein n=1 Tax=Salicibibacter cibi TaxID=2743001 RepID=A0A7T6Z8N2_9BACI|nr:TRAP transporter substrate-binding protein [Salicibibacter cibi]QQK78861.1 TRAP transporter substrate-binding protein [Salicibibacter cibi]
MPRKKIIKLNVLILVMALVLIGCGEDTSSNDDVSEGEFEFQIGHSTTTDNQQHVGAEKIAELLEESSDGTITADVFELEQLGGEVAELQALQDGSQDITIVAHASATNFVPEWSIFNLPYLFDSTEQANAVLDEIGDEFFEMLPEHGLKGLGWLSSIERNVFSTTPIESAEDLQDFDIRVIEAPGFVDAYSALGAQPVTMPGGEVYSGLQQGVIDGAVNSPELFLNFGHHEVADYYNMTSMHYMPIAIVMSLDVWESLSTEQQELVQEVTDEAVEIGREHYTHTYEEAIEERMEEEEVTVVDTDISDMQERTADIHNSMTSEIPNGEELLELIENTKEEVE